METNKREKAGGKEKRVAAKNKIWVPFVFSCLLDAISRKVRVCVREREREREREFVQLLVLKDVGVGVCVWLSVCELKIHQVRPSPFLLSARN